MSLLTLRVMTSSAPRNRLTTTKGWDDRPLPKRRAPAALSECPILHGWGGHRDPFAIQARVIRIIFNNLRVGKADHHVVEVNIIISKFFVRMIRDAHHALSSQDLDPGQSRAH